MALITSSALDLINNPRRGDVFQFLEPARRAALNISLWVNSSSYKTPPEIWCRSNCTKNSIVSGILGRIPLPNIILPDERITVRFSESGGYKLAHILDSDGNFLANFRLSATGIDFRFKPLTDWAPSKAGSIEQNKEIDEWLAGKAETINEQYILIDGRGRLAIGHTGIELNSLGNIAREAILWFKTLDGQKSLVVYEADGETVIQEANLRIDSCGAWDTAIAKENGKSELPRSVSDIYSYNPKPDPIRSTIPSGYYNVIPMAEIPKPAPLPIIAKVKKPRISPDAVTEKIAKAYANLSTGRDLGACPISANQLAKAAGLSQDTVLKRVKMNTGNMILVLMQKGFSREIIIDQRKRRVIWAINYSLKNGIKYSSPAEFARHRLNISAETFNNWIKEDDHLPDMITDCINSPNIAAA